MIVFLCTAFQASWLLLNQSSLYILFGLLVGGLLKAFLSPAYIAAHLGAGRFSSVFKAALFGIPLPLCSCGVLPAAAVLKKKGANNGAVAAFLIATPESGIDSISISWALLDPIMTIARPLSAFISAAVAGIAENLISFRPAAARQIKTACCSECGQPARPSFWQNIRTGLKSAATELWADIAGWFFLGIFAAGIIAALLPDANVSSWLGSGLSAKLLMLAFGIPLYICATASTPIAAALILKGASPGTTLVFLLAGPATNVTSLTVLVGLLGKRAAGLYLLSIAVVSVFCGLAVDAIYLSLGISVAATLGKAGEMLPGWITLLATLTLFALSVRPLLAALRRWLTKTQQATAAGGCACAGHCSGSPEKKGKKSCC